ncbi:FAD assembly factor SdhE [Natronospira bacteriovora]|uniref:FAD assembly factor SdhE n=1 Tax=Natronospira bacteriovora TaxID=3069753 RepID=A0ABU0W2W2_9GAMM|nr:succinate dehydrogenase assembly factor 2 [Natronospira sp. AB-CW4]MDQ2068297.1 succinate dehydrogenase assembly factor 2 [Natronospira sp. AB-CW4]
MSGDRARELSRLRWLCRRGMKELDVMLERYLAESWSSASESERAAFDRLLSCQDPELWDWLSGRAQPGDRELAHVVSRIRQSDPA